MGRARVSFPGMGAPRAVSARVSGEGLSLFATACRAGPDLTVTVTGGEAPHVGCIVVAQAHPARDDARRTSVTSSVVAFVTHREEALARPLAERLAERLGGTVVVAAGVHVDRLSREGIAAYLRLGRRLAERLLRVLAS